MEVRHALHPEHVKTFDSDRIRAEFLVDGLFVPGKPKFVFSLNDRMVVGGICPESPIALEGDASILGTEYFLERREMGIINLGGAGTVSVDGDRYEIGNKECLYIGMGARNISLHSLSKQTPAKFLAFSGPAHHSYPTRKASPPDANRLELGSDDTSNKRTIYQYIHPDGIQSCNVVMGFTMLERGSAWNTMPCHTHLRRMEFYCYFDLPESARVFHFMGEPCETRHILVADGQGVISPSWSIHAGAGTEAYSFVWAMLGDNQSFADMDPAAMSELR